MSRFTAQNLEAPAVLQCSEAALRAAGVPAMSRSRRCPRLGGAAQLGTAGSCGAGMAAGLALRWWHLLCDGPSPAMSCCQALLAQLAAACLPLTMELAGCSFAQEPSIGPG